MDSVTDDRVLICRVSPFGNLRIDAYVPLPVAYRSLSRPSSAPDAKAFPLRSFSLNRSGSLNYAGSFRISSTKLCALYSSTIASEFPSVALLVFPLFSFQCAAASVVPLPGGLTSVRMRTRDEKVPFSRLLADQTNEVFGLRWRQIARPDAEAPRSGASSLKGNLERVPSKLNNAKCQTQKRPDRRSPAVSSTAIFSLERR